MGMSYSHIWDLKDHLGNNRVLADGNGNTIALNDYDPFGEFIPVASSSEVLPFPLGATESPYRYEGFTVVYLAWDPQQHIFHPLAGIGFTPLDMQVSTGE